MAAAEAAKEIYDSLRNGGYEYFTDMTYRNGRIPENYRKQLVMNSKMFLFQMQKDHGGIHDIQIVDCRTDSARSSVDANAFLLLCFNDSTKDRRKVDDEMTNQQKEENANTQISYELRQIPHPHGTLVRTP